ncbi:MAG: hypothetical protein SF339_22370 [Blastocatellia bacterium]|nr:hypothetical protein [Blastocatellia bacterium]
MNRMAQTIPQANAATVGREQARGLPAGRVIPYEYVADFMLTGEVGNLVQDVINVSVEGVFVAVSIGYGLVEDRGESLILPAPSPTTLSEVALGHLPPDALLDGFRLNPNLRGLIGPNGRLNDQLPVSPEMFQRLKPVDNFSFLLSLVDTGTGRELQNKPVNSLATLGGADGRRPFKMLPQPMVFLPRSTIRLQIEERTAGVTGRLFITLQGYKVLGLAGASEDETRRLAEFEPMKRIPVYDNESGTYRTLGETLERDAPSTRVVPFDYISTLDLTGRPGNIVEDEVPINVDGNYVATAIGYSLDTGDAKIEITPPPDSANQVNLSEIKLSEIGPAQSLFDGIRIHPLRTRFAFAVGGQLKRVSQDLLGRLFQSVNRPEEARFLYSITDTGTGRDLQNQRVFNVAGLGIANGERPFKVFHKPMTFLPRSSIRVQVEERFGRGRLFLVFQGYKILR